MTAKSQAMDGASRIPNLPPDVIECEYDEADQDMISFPHRSCREALKNERGVSPWDVDFIRMACPHPPGCGQSLPVNARQMECPGEASPMPVDCVSFCHQNHIPASIRTETESVILAMQDNRIIIREHVVSVHEWKSMSSGAVCYLHAGKRTEFPFRPAICVVFLTGSYV